MSPWSRFPFVRIALTFLMGILASCYGSSYVGGVSCFLGALLLSYAFLVARTPPTLFPSRSTWIGALGLMSIFLLGYLRGVLHEVRHDPRHLTHDVAAVEAYQAVALEDNHTREKHHSVVVAVRRVRIAGAWEPSRGKVLLSWPKEVVYSVHYGDVLFIKGQPRVTRKAKNPHAFDYAAFLGLSQVYHQHFVVGGQVAVMAHQQVNTLKSWSFKTLRYCQSVFTRSIQNPEARAFVLALVLGQKDMLTPDISAPYAHTGTMHVLAVSGLHVGVVYWFVHFLLKYLGVFGNMRWLSSTVSLTILWWYAFLTGLSPSVLRATTMFTLIALASSRGRRTDTYQILAMAAFLWLFWDPWLLFSVGFQLSYMAVLGIVYLQPSICAAYTPSNWFLNQLWLLTSVSLGAQVATTPLSIYYFHRFPTYFLCANWVVVPAAFVILCLGLTTLMTSFWGGLSMLVARLLEGVVIGVHAFVVLLQKLPCSVLGPMHWEGLTVFLLYTSLVLLLLFCNTKKIRYLVATNVLAVGMALQAV